MARRSRVETCQLFLAAPLTKNRSKGSSADEADASPQLIAEEEEPYGGYYLIYDDRPVLVQKYQAKNAKLTYIPTWKRYKNFNLVENQCATWLLEYVWAKNLHGTYIKPTYNLHETYLEPTCDGFRQFRLRALASLFYVGFMYVYVGFYYIHTCLVLLAMYWITVQNMSCYSRSCRYACCLHIRVSYMAVLLFHTSSHEGVKAFTRACERQTMRMATCEEGW